MGIFDAILGTPNTSAIDNASQWAQTALDQAQGQGNTALRNQTKAANQALTSNTQSGLGSLNSGYGSAIAALTGAGNQAQGLLNAGTTAGVNTTLANNAAYAPYAQSGGAANTMLGNALGLNGSQGNAAATSAFQTSPGYQFQVDQSTGAAERAAAAAGGLGSGSVLDAVTRLGSNLANGEWQNWIGNLSNQGAQGLQANAAISGADQAAGAMQYGGGQAGAQLAQNTGQSIGTAYGAQGTGQASLYGNLGSGLSNNLTGLGQGLSQNDLTTAQNQAGVMMQQGLADTNAANSSNSILSKLIGGVTGLPFGQTSLSTPNLTTGSTNTTSGSNSSGVGFNLSPFTSGSSSSSGGGGLFGPLFNSIGTGLSNSMKSFL